MVRIKIFLLSMILTGVISTSFAKAPVSSERKSLKKPQRIIRTCCLFGSDVPFGVIPGVKWTDITSIEKIGSHYYLGKSSEENGIVYTRRGGFLDMGHLRDNCDWTAFIYTQLIENRATGKYSTEIGYEGGGKNLNVIIPESLTDNDLAMLAGKIAYDLSIWHEIATWFGASSVPFVPEKYSSFSPEDPFSNLLGATIGMEAIISELPYEDAVTEIISRTLKDFEIVPTELETYLAMEAVHNIWWTRTKRLPSSKILLQRQTNVYPCLRPWLVSGWQSENTEAIEIKVPDYASTGELLSSLYKLEFKLNYNFPVKKMFPDRKNRTIDQNDFERLLSEIESELTEMNLNFK